MASEPIRDPVSDHLLTPQNAALIIIDYQPVQVNSIASMDRQKLIDNIVGVAKIGLAYGLPIIHSEANCRGSGKSLSSPLGQPCSIQARSVARSSGGSRRSLENLP